MKVKEESKKVGLKLNIQKTKIMASGPITSWQMGKPWKQWQTLFFWAPKSLQMVITAIKLKDACSLKEKLWQPRQHIKKQRHYFAELSRGQESTGEETVPIPGRETKGKKHICIPYLPQLGNSLISWNYHDNLWRTYVKICGLCSHRAKYSW